MRYSTKNLTTLFCLLLQNFQAAATSTQRNPTTGITHRNNATLASSSLSDPSLDLHSNQRGHSVSLHKKSPQKVLLSIWVVRARLELNSLPQASQLRVALFCDLRKEDWRDWDWVLLDMIWCEVFRAIVVSSLLLLFVLVKLQVTYWPTSQCVISLSLRHTLILMWWETFFVMNWKNVPDEAKIWDLEWRK